MATTATPDIRPPREPDPLWFKDAIIYQLHVKAFFDSTNDGIGDFTGLTRKLDYIQDLGVNTIWLLPFYPSPLRDDGYDIADYRAVHPQYGTLRDFRTFVRHAHDRGLRVITELVINHTSDQHPWFQAARKAAPGSARRNYYVWSDNHEKYRDARIIFTDTEQSNWAWDPVARQYYWHRFFSHQPDLNFDNPQVVKAVIRIMRFWLDAGVDGLRLDAIPYLVEREGTSCENLPETHVVLRQLRAALDARYTDRMFLAEANQWPEDVLPYFGDGDECHMAFHFPVMPRIYMAVAQEDRHPIVEIMEQTPDIPPNCQWANFLRNHDELTLEMVTDRERDYMYQVFASDPRMRINLGIRRRLAPLMDNDMDRIRLLKSLLLSLPGSPVLYYGDEIGMGDNIFLGDRNGVRTPMQWSPDRNAGFSRADPQRLYLPPIMDPVYGYEAVNVEALLRDPSSLLNWTRRMLVVRKAHKAFGRGTLEFLKPGNRKILAFVRAFEDDVILCVSNLSRAAQPVELDLSRFKGMVPVELLGRVSFPPIGELPYLLTLPAYGFYWFRLAVDAQVPAWHKQVLPPAPLPLIVLFAGWESLFPEEVAQRDPSRRPMAEKLRRELDAVVWPGFLGAQRWFGAKGETVERLEFGEHVEVGDTRGEWLMAIVRVRIAGTESQTYFVPLALAWEDPSDDGLRPLLTRAAARVRRGAKLGLMFDALADVEFSRWFVEAIGENRDLAFGRGHLRFRSTEAFAGLVTEPLSTMAAVPAEQDQSNSSVIIGERLVLKVYRRVRSGINPELEIGQFLTTTSPYDHIAPVAGYVEYEDDAGVVSALAMLQGFVGNQGDGWRYTLDFLERHLEATRNETGEDIRLQEQARETIYQTMLHQLGVRTAELHNALAQGNGNASFEPEAVTTNEASSWADAVLVAADETTDFLDAHRRRLPDALHADLDELIAMRALLPERVPELIDADLHTVKLRFHGDYHLGQVLVVNNDFVIIDFEGEPLRPLAERRAKHSPLKDVAGMLRSFDYAAATAVARLTADRQEDRAVLEPRAQAWRERTTATFLDGYRATINVPGLNGNSAVDGLIRLFEIEKAFYELRYELDNRPEWLGIPLRGVLELLRRTGTPT